MNPTKNDKVAKRFRKRFRWAKTNQLVNDKKLYISNSIKMEAVRIIDSILPKYS